METATQMISQPVKRPRPDKKEKKVQTAFRLPASLLEDVKEEAARRDMTTNAYVTRVLEDALTPEWPRISKAYQISEETRALSIVKDWKEPSAAALEADPRLAAILGYE